MVYRSGDVRHDRVPLRLGAAGTDTVVEAEVAGPLRCSHFDAFRFFSAEAAPRNAGSPSRATQQDWEQPGCLHANMDLYKWSYKLSPLIDSEMLLDCLELAAAAREIDMRASPYDLSGLRIYVDPRRERGGPRRVRALPESHRHPCRSVACGAAGTV